MPKKADRKYLILCGVIVVLAAVVGVYVYNYGFTFSSSDAAGSDPVIILRHAYGGESQRVVTGEKIKINWPSLGYRVPVNIRLSQLGEPKGTTSELIAENYSRRSYEWTVPVLWGAKEPIVEPFAYYQITVHRYSEDAAGGSESEIIYKSEPFTVGSPY